MPSNEERPPWRLFVAPKHPIRAGCALLLLIGLLPLGLWVIPNPPTPEPFQSGGLGLTKAAWEQNHASRPYDSGPLPTSGIGFYGREMTVYFWPEGWLSLGESRITGISGGVSDVDGANTAREASRSLLPADAQLVRTIQNPTSGKGIMDIYHSTSLETRYPNRWFTPDPWNGVPAGTFYVTSYTYFAILIPIVMDEPTHVLLQWAKAPAITEP